MLCLWNSQVALNICLYLCLYYVIHITVYNSIYKLEYVFIICYNYNIYTLYIYNTVIYFIWLTAMTAMLYWSKSFVWLSEVWASWLVKLVREPRWEPKKKHIRHLGHCRADSICINRIVNRIVQRCQMSKYLQWGCQMNHSVPERADWQVTMIHNDSQCKCICFSCTPMKHSNHNPLQLRCNTLPQRVGT